MGDRKIRIGLVIDYLISEYTENLINGVVACCKELDIELIIYQIGELKQLKSDCNYQCMAVSSLISIKNVDGIIVNAGTQLHGMSKNDFLSYLHSFKPLKVINIAVSMPEIPSITVDCDKAFASMLDYMIQEQNCRKIGFMTADSKSQEIKRRNKIFFDTLKKNGIEEKDVVVWKSGFEYSSAYRCLHEYYKSTDGKFDFDTLVAVNDDLAYACMDFCRYRLNLNIPRDVIVTGFDDLQRASFSDPTLSSINQKVNYQGYKAVQVLYDYICGKKIPMNQTVMGQAVLRQSTARKAIVQENFSSDEYITVDKSSGFEYSSRFSVSEWYTKRSQIYQAAKLYMGMLDNTSVEQLRTAMTNQLRNFGFQAAAVVLYESPIEKESAFEYFNLPHKARLLAGFDYTTAFNAAYAEEIVYFNPNEEILPKEYFHFTWEGAITMALFKNEIQYGYIIIRKGNYDMGVYDLVAKTMACEIASAIANDNIQKERNYIQDRFQRMDKIAHTDELTGLANRRGFMEVGKTLLQFAEVMNQYGCVLYCDMDGLKKINDTFGHECGDIAIQAQGKILKDNFRANDIVSRHAGDEFAIICPGLKKDDFGDIKNKIEKACKQWTEESESKFGISISLGCAEYPDEKAGYNLEELLKIADAELYNEKKEKKSLQKKNSLEKL